MVVLDVDFVDWVGLIRLRRVFVVGVINVVVDDVVVRRLLVVDGRVRRVGRNSTVFIIRLHLVEVVLVDVVDVIDVVLVVDFG